MLKNKPLKTVPINVVDLFLTHMNNLTMTSQC